MSNRARPAGAVGAQPCSAARRAPGAETITGRIVKAATLLLLASVMALSSPGFDPPAASATEVPAPTAGRFVYVVPVDDAIGPVTARFMVDGIQRGERDGAAAVVIQLDTPGGLDTAMRQIVKAIFAAEVPVIVYVAPSGARAASAGMYITLAAPVAAMAPGTNIGAATPVTLGGPGSPDTAAVMRAKMTNDAAAYARSLAERHGRNADWAERAVRQAASIAAEDAVRDSIVDLVAESVGALLESVDGRTVLLNGREVVLQTSGAEERRLKMSWREMLMALLTNPNIAYLLFLGGILGLAIELYNPGAILPGVVGAIALILAFFAFQSLPVSVAGVLLILLGLVLFILEVKVPSYGILSIGAVTSLVLGSLFLFDRGSSFRISLAVLLPAVLTFAGVFAVIVWLAIRAQGRRKLGGADGMAGEIGIVVTALAPEGRISVHGEYWNARSRVPLAPGARVRIVRIDGLWAEVEPAEPPA